jgi:Transposase, Mutator family
MMAETKLAPMALDAFIESYAMKYEKAADCLSKDRDTLLAFYDFPGPSTGNTFAETNPIESTFATVRHRTIRSKRGLSNRTARGGLQTGRGREKQRNSGDPEGEIRFRANQGVGLSET